MRPALLLTTLAVLAAPAAERAPLMSTFRADSTMVLVHVSVVDSHDRPIAGLGKHQFRVFEDGKEQSISAFAREDAPLSIGVILDTSGSMDGKIHRAREVIARFCENLNPDDEVFVVTVHGEVSLAADTTRDCGEIQNALLLAKPSGLTPLLDAVPLAFQKLRAVKDRRKAILLISDGGENASRFRAREIRRIAVEAGVPIYAAELTSTSRNMTPEEILGPQVLQDLIDDSGGRHWEIDSRSRPAEAARMIAAEMHEQYVIGYRSPEMGRDGKFRKIAVKVSRDAGTPRLSVSFRSGYFAPID